MNLLHSYCSNSLNVHEFKDILIEIILFTKLAFHLR